MTGEEQRLAGCGRKAIERAEGRERGEGTWGRKRELPGEVEIAGRRKHDGGEGADSQRR